MKAPTSPRALAIKGRDRIRETKRHAWRRTVIRPATSPRRGHGAASETSAAPSSPLDGVVVEVPVPVAAAARKECTDCGRWSTPMWRPGPGGPKTLCNACGIKYRRSKKKETSPFPNEKKVLVTVPISTAAAAAASSSCADGGHRIESISTSLEMLSTDELKSRQREKQQRMLMVIWENQKQRRKREKGRHQIAAAAMAAGKDVAEAALLLLSLSSSSSAMLVHS